MYILNLTQKSKLFSAVQIEAINIYAILHSRSEEECAKLSLHEFDVDLEGLHIAELLLHNFAEVDDLNIDLIIGNLNSLIDDYEISRINALKNDGEYSKDILVADHLIYLALLEFTDYIQEVCEDDHLKVINRLYKLINDPIDEFEVGFKLERADEGDQLRDDIN